MERTVQPELLDSLPPDDPAAIHSRRDLRRINWWMNSAGLVHRLAPRVPAPARIVELGCGDGTLALKLVRRWAPAVPAGTLTLVDLHPVVSSETQAALRSLGWNVEVVAADAFVWLETAGARFDITFANLFLHHFEAPALARLFAATANRTDAFVSLDPKRGRVPLLGCATLPLLGCNHVTLHDARLSIHAGFTGNELSRIWAQSSPAGEWRLTEHATGLFSHGFRAERKTP